MYFGGNRNRQSRDDHRQTEPANFSEEIAPKRLTLSEKYLRRTEWLLTQKNELMRQMLIKENDIKNNPNYDEEKKIEFSGLMIALEREIVSLERNRIMHLRDQAETEIKEVAKVVYYNNSSRSPSPYEYDNYYDQRKRHRSRSASRQSSSNHRDLVAEKIHSASRQSSNHRDLLVSEKRHSRESNYIKLQKDRSRSRQKQSSEKFNNHQKSRSSKQRHSESPQNECKPIKKQRQETQSESFYHGRSDNSKFSKNIEISCRTSPGRTVNVVKDSTNPVYFQPESNSLKMVPNLKVEVESFNNSLRQSPPPEKNKCIDSTTVSSYAHGSHGKIKCRSSDDLCDNVQNKSFIDLTLKLPPKHQRINYPEMESVTRISLNPTCSSKSTFYQDTILSSESSATDVIDDDAISNDAAIVINTQQTGIPPRILDKNRLWFDEECLMIARLHHKARKVYEKNPNNINLDDYSAKKEKMDYLFRKKFNLFQRKNSEVHHQPPTSTIVTSHQKTSDDNDIEIMDKNTELSRKVKLTYAANATPIMPQNENVLANEPWYDTDCDSIYKLKCDAWDIYQVYETNSNKNNYERCRLLVDNLFQTKAKEYHEKQLLLLQQQQQQQEEEEEEQEAAKEQIVEKDYEEDFNDHLWYDEQCQDAENAMRVALEIYEKNENEDNLEVYNIRKRQCEKLFQRKRQEFLDDQLKTCNSSNNRYQHSDNFDGHQMHNWQEFGQQDDDNQDQQRRMITPPPPKLCQSDLEIFNSSSNTLHQSTNFSQSIESNSKSSLKSFSYDQINDGTVNKMPLNNCVSMEQQRRRAVIQKSQPKWQSSFKEVIDPNSFDIVGKSTQKLPSSSRKPTKSDDIINKGTTQTKTDELTKNWRKFVKTIGNMQYVSPQYRNDEIESKKQHERYDTGVDGRRGGNSDKSATNHRYINDSLERSSKSSYHSHHRNAK